MLVLTTNSRLRNQKYWKSSVKEEMNNGKQ